MSISGDRKVRRSATVKIERDGKRDNIKRVKSSYQIRNDYSSSTLNRIVPGIEQNDITNMSDIGDISLPNSLLTETSTHATPSPPIQEETAFDCNEGEEGDVSEVPPSYEEVSQQVMNGDCYDNSFSSLDPSTYGLPSVQQVEVLDPGFSAESPFNDRVIPATFVESSNQAPETVQTCYSANGNARTWTNPMIDSSSVCSLSNNIITELENDKLNKPGRSTLDIENQSANKANLSDVAFWIISSWLILGAIGLISNGQYYEAHQAVRTIAARYIRSKNYSDAIEVLFSTAKLLLEANQPGSASDLTLYLIDTLKTAQIPIDSVSRAKIVQLVKLFNPDEPTLRSIAQEAISWSVNVPSDSKSITTATAGATTTPSRSSLGDPELHHVFGTILATANEAYEAEKHLLLGTSESPAVLGNLLYEWYTEDSAKENAGIYLSRGVLGYLALENIRDAIKVLNVFINHLISTLREGDDYEISTAYDQPIYVFTQKSKLSFLVFLQLLVITCRSKNSDMFNRLKLRYKGVLDQIPALHEILDRIGLVYFKIQPPRNTNMLQNLMGGLFN